MVLEKNAPTDWMTFDFQKKKKKQKIVDSGGKNA